MLLIRGCVGNTDPARLHRDGRLEAQAGQRASIGGCVGGQGGGIAIKARSAGAQEALLAQLA